MAAAFVEDVHQAAAAHQPPEGAVMHGLIQVSGKHRGQNSPVTQETGVDGLSPDQLSQALVASLGFLLMIVMFIGGIIIAVVR